MISTTEISTHTTLLSSTSETDLPTALSACKGLGSSPFYKRHVFELGVLRTITNGAHHFVLRSDKYTLPATQATKLANQRTFDFLRSAEHRRVKLLTIGPENRMAGVTGQIRHDTCPFLWPCTIGITNSATDDDSLTQIWLLANHVILCCMVLMFHTSTK